MNYFKNAVSTKTGALIAAILIVALCSTAHSTAVNVVNYPSLMGMVQKMVTNVITNKIQDVWNKEVAVKLEPGIINTTGITIPSINMGSWTEQVVSDYVGKAGGRFGNNGKYYKDLAQREAGLGFPAASQSVSDFQKKTREISILLAGAPNAKLSDLQNYAKARIEYLAKHSVDRAAAERKVIEELGQFKKSDITQKANVASFEKAAEGVYMAEKAKKELAAIKPSSFDGVKSDQAVKDLAKLTYYNTILQAQILSVMSNREMSHAISSSGQ